MTAVITNPHTHTVVRAGGRACAKLGECVLTLACARGCAHGCARARARVLVCSRVRAGLRACTCGGGGRAPHAMKASVAFLMCACVSVCVCVCLCVWVGAERAKAILCDGAKFTRAEV